jgi:hypothetical protein
VPQAAELDLNPVVVSPGGWAVVDLKLRLAPSSVDIDRATLRMLGGDSAVNFAARLSATSESKVPAGTRTFART